MSDRARFVVAFVAGVPLAFVGLVGGLLVMGCMLFAALLTLFNLGRVAFAGLTISLGGTWLIVFVLANQDCARPGQPCGATPLDLTPHIVISAGLVAFGVAAAVLSWRRARGAADPR